MQARPSTDTEHAAARARLLELIAALQDGRPIPPATASWLHRGAVRFALGEASTLCGALKLRSRGCERMHAAEARAARDQCIGRAFELHGGTVGAFRRTVLRFVAITWPRVRGLESPPARLTPVQCELFRAAINGPIPTSARQLRRLMDTK